jgi:hypothetical protein
VNTDAPQEEATLASHLEMVPTVIIMLADVNRTVDIMEIQEMFMCSNRELLQGAFLGLHRKIVVHLFLPSL